MSDWDATSYDARDNLLHVVGRQADALFALAGAPDAWEAPTACPEWSATSEMPAGAEPCEIGVRVTSGHNGGTWKVTAGPAGFSYAAGDVDDLPATLEFDPGSLVLTAFGRSNAGTVRGDVALAERYLNLFFRI